LTLGQRGSHQRLSASPQQIVVGHTNLPPITDCYPQLLDIIHGRNLQTVTLAEVFA
jgi:hypothetical protein